MRTPITLKIKFKSSNLEQFIERYSVDVSRGGIFIRTKEPLPVGTQLRFEFQLQDAQSLIAGDGTVVWIREHDPTRTGVAPGMGVRFDKLAVESQKVLDRILVEKNKRGDAQLESRFDAGVRASASASGTLSSPPPRTGGGRDDFSGGDSKQHTPLPGAVPGLETPGDEFGNESTRVMQNELVRSLADRTRGIPDDHAANAFSEPEPTRKATVEELKLAVAEKAEAKVQIAPEAAQPEAKKEEPKPEPKLEAKPIEIPIEIKEEPKPEPQPEKIEARPPKEEAKPVEKKEEPRIAARVVDKLPKEELRPVTAMPPSAMTEKRGGGGMWVALVGVAVVAVVGAFVVFHKSDEDKNTTPPVAQDTPKPTETPVVPTPAPEKVDNPPAVAAAPTGAPTTPPVEAPKPVDKPGLAVAITSEPTGATVTVDGKPLPDGTPTTISGLDVKKVYDVRVVLKGFREWKVKLKPKANDKLDAALVPNEKLVEVSSTPAGADVVLDGRRVGRTPFTIHKFDLGKTHAIELKRAGYVTQSRTVSATDTFEPKGDKDVLALVIALEAEPKADKTAATKTATPVVAKHPSTSKSHPPVATKKPDEKPAEKPAEATPAPAAEKPAEAAAPSEKPVVEDKPAADKAAADKPAADKPAADKPASDDKAASDKGDNKTKTPAWMQEKPGDKPSGDKPSGDSPPPQQ